MRGKKIGRTLRSGLLGAASMIALGVALAPIPAAAQFVCGGSATGAEPQTGGGAVAIGANSVACGTSAQAIGGSSTAIGAAAGVGSAATNTQNTAVGFTAGQGV